MVHTPYQLLIRELETLLPPRVVSRSLKDGLTLLGRTADDVTLQDLEQLMRGPIQRQLQALMTEDNARSSVESILGRISNPTLPDAEPPGPAERKRTTLTELNDALRPYNLYFEWPEVQKLRAQVQLIETEMRAGEETAQLVSEARDQLGVIRQKLSDQLSVQASELADLEDASNRLTTLGGPRVRRLQNLLEQIRSAQEEGQLASAELQRARELSTDLRKLLESSVYSTVVPAASEDDEPIIIPPDELPGEVSERLLQLDLEQESHRLELLAKQHAHLLGLEEDLQKRMTDLRDRITDGESCAAEVKALELALEHAFNRARNDLTAELSQIAADVEAMATPVGQRQLRQALQVANGILMTTLPDPGDIRHLRDLHTLAREQAETMRTQVNELPDADLVEQFTNLVVDGREGLLNELFQLEREFNSLPSGTSAETDDLRAALHAARALLGEGEREPDLDNLWMQLEDLRGSVLNKLETFDDRLDDALITFERVRRLNSEDVAMARRTLAHLSSQRDLLGELSLARRSELEDSLSEVESILETLSGEYEATRAIADKLVSASILDDILGGSSAPPEQQAPPRSDPLSEGDKASGVTGLKELDELLGELGGERGVERLLLFDGDVQLSGPANGSPDRLVNAVLDLERDLVELGAGLRAGPTRLLTLELSGLILAVAWPTPRHRVLVVVDVPATLSLVLHRLRLKLPVMAGLLNDPAFDRRA